MCEALFLSAKQDARSEAVKDDIGGALSQPDGRKGPRRKHRIFAIGVPGRTHSHRLDFSLQRDYPWPKAVRISSPAHQQARWVDRSRAGYRFETSTLLASSHELSGSSFHMLRSVQFSGCETLQGNAGAVCLKLGKGMVRGDARLGMLKHRFHMQGILTICKKLAENH